MLKVDATVGDVWDLRTLAQFQEGEMSPGLSQDFMDGYIKFFKPSPVMNSCGFLIGVLPISGFPISCYNCEFPIKGPKFESYG